MEQQPWMPKFGNNLNVNVNRRVYPESRPVENKNETSAENKSLVKLLDGIITASIFAIFFGFPLFFTGLSFQGIDFEKQVYFYFWVLLGLIAWGSKCGYLGEMKIKRTSLDLPIIAFWLFYLASAIFSIDRWHSFFGFFGDPSRGFLNITALTILYYIIVNNFDSRLLKWILRAVVGSGSIVIIYTALAILGVKFAPDSIANYLPLSLIGSVKGIAVFVGAMLPIYLMQVLKLQSQEETSPVKKKVFSAIYLFLIAANLFLILALYAYVPWLGLLFGIVVFLIFILSKIIRPKEAWTVLPMTVFIIVLAFLLIGTVNIAKVKLPPAVSLPFKTAFTISKDSLQDNFFLGNGPANYSYAFSKHLPSGFDNMNVRFFQGEGLLMEVVPTIGIGGTILFIILVLTFLGSNVFLLIRDKEKNKLASLGIMSATMVLLVDVLFIRAEAGIFTWSILFAILTTAAISKESEIKNNYLNFSLKASPKFALTLAFISLLIIAAVAFAFVFIGKIYVADLNMGFAIRTAAKEGKISETGSIAKIFKAIKLNNREGRYFTRLGQEYMVLTNEEMMKEEKDRDINKIQVYLNSAIQASKQGENLFKSKDVTSIESLGQIYENSGIYVVDALKFAQEEYQKASDLEPGNPNFYISLGKIKTRTAASATKEDEKKKLVEEARDLFQKAIDTRKNSIEGYYNLGLAQEALGQLDDAIKNVTTAANLQPNNINYIFNLGRLYQERGKDDDNKIAEDLFNKILGVNDKEINTNFSLGMLYEKTGRKSEAIDKYKKVIDLLPANSDKARSQIEKMVSNIKNGVENTPENLGLNQNQSGKNQGNSLESSN